MKGLCIERTPAHPAPGRRPSWSSACRRATGEAEPARACGRAITEAPLSATPGSLRRRAHVPHRCAARQDRSRPPAQPRNDRRLTQVLPGTPSSRRGDDGDHAETRRRQTVPIARGGRDTAEEVVGPLGGLRRVPRAISQTTTRPAGRTTGSVCTTVEEAQNPPTDRTAAATTPAANRPHHLDTEAFDPESLSSDSLRWAK
jgi:hypothetical protein